MGDRKEEKEVETTNPFGLRKMKPFVVSALVTEHEPWVRAQIKAFTGWANNVLVNRHIDETRLGYEMSSGVYFIELLMKLEGKYLGHYSKTPVLKFHRMENLDFVLRFLRKQKEKLVGHTADLLVDDSKNLKMVLGLLWTMILRYSVKKVYSQDKKGDLQRVDGGGSQAQDSLLQWVQEQMAVSAALAGLPPDAVVKVNNWKEDFQDGRVLCHLFNSLKPAVLDVSGLKKTAARENLTSALQLSEEYLKIPQLLDVNLMVAGTKEPQSVMTYVSLFKERAMNPLVEEPRLTALQKQAVAGLVHPASIENHVAPSEFKSDLFNPAAVVAPKKQAEKPLTYSQLRAASGLGHPSAIDVSNEGLDQNLVQDLKDKDLLSWVNRKTFKFGVQVHDLQQSWRDPVVMTALAKAFDNNVDMKAISQATAVVDVSNAMEAVKIVLNTTPMDPKDMVEKPSQPAIRQYVSNVRESERRKNLLKWLNGRINPFQVSAEDFEQSFQDPRVVSALVKSFHPSSIDMNDVTKATAIPSVEKAMGVAEDKLDINRNMSPTTMIESPAADEVVEYVNKFYDRDRRNKLLAWVNKRIAPFDQQVTNFSDSFQDPHIISAMVNSFSPDAVDMDKVGNANGPTAVSDISKAFVVSLQELEIRPPMSAEDMAFSPEEESVMDYMREFKELADKRELLAWCNKKIEPKGRHADNFTTSFQSPDTLGSLADHFLPGELDVDGMSPATAVKDVAKSMELADAELSIAPRMSPMEMVKHPHEDKCAGYISDFRGFERKEELLAWVNSKISKYNLKADDFTTSFQDPKIFSALTKHFFPERVDLQQVNKANAVPSVDKAMQICEKELKVPRTYSAEAMIRAPVEENCYEYIAKLRHRERIQDLLAWLNKRIRPFQLSADNFTTSFQDPKTLSGLVKSFRPNHIDLNQVAEETALRDLKRAMDVAHQELSIAPSVGPSVMLNQGDEDSVYEYVDQFRQAERERELLAWLNSESHLGQFGLHADNFESSFQQPEILTGLVESFLPDAVDHRAAKGGDPVPNIKKAMDVSEDKLEIAPTITAQAMAQKPSKDATVEYVAKFREAESKRELLAWVNARIGGYGLEAKDFGESFKDPSILTGLVKSFDPSLSLANVGPVTAVADIDKAMSVCEQRVQVPRPMSAAEMASDPNPELVAQYAADMRDQERRMELLKWLNGKIRPFSLEAKDFSDSFKDPKIVCGLVEAFKPYSFQLHEVTRETGLDSVQTAFNIADQKFSIPPTMPPKTMLERPSEEEIMPYVAAFRDYEYKRDLLDWVNKRIAPFELKANNFGESFTDPHIFCGLVKSFQNGDIDLAAVSGASALRDVDNAMDVSEKKIGVKRSLKPDQMITDRPNEESVIHYIAEFRERERQGELLGWLNDRVSVYDVSAENFQDSFRDPKLVCGLVKTFENDAVSLNNLEGKNGVLAVEGALKVGKERVGVEPTATAAKILTNPSSDENIKYVADMREKDRLRELLKWLNTKIAPFGLNAQNFHSSFQDPKILSGLVKHFEPREISLQSISEQTAVKDLTRAMDLAADKIGVEPNMTPDQMLFNPQEADVADYVADFREAERKRELLAWLNSRLAPFELEAKDFDESFKDPKIFGGLVKSFLPEEVDLFKMKDATAVQDVDQCMEQSETKLGVQRQMGARTMIEHPQEKDVMKYVAAFKELAERKDLLQWVNSKISPFQLEAKNFDESWKNPKILTGLVQTFEPSSLDVSKCDDKNSIAHIEQAMKVAEEKMKVTPTLSAKSMATNPEAAKVVKYAKKMREAERTRELLKWLNSKLGQHNLHATDFTTSFKDPKITCGLVKCFANEVPLEGVTGAKDVEVALSTGERKCKVNRTSTPDAILSRPDEMANKNYVAAWRAYERQQQLLEWLNKQIAPSGLPQVKSFDIDFQSGKVMVALVNAFKGTESIALAKVNDNSKQTFVSKAFKIAEDDFKISPLMDARTMCESPHADRVEAYIQKFKDYQDGLVFRDQGDNSFDASSGRLNEDSRRNVMQNDRASNKIPPRPLYLAKDVKKVDLADNKLGIILNENMTASLNVSSAAKYGHLDKEVHPGSQPTPEVEWRGQVEVVKEVPLTALQQAALDGWVHPASIVEKIEPADYKAEVYHPAAVPWDREDMESLHEQAIRVPPQPQWLRDLINGYEFTNYKTGKNGEIQKEKVFLFYEPDLSPEGMKGSLCWNLEGKRAIVPGQKIDIHHIHELCIGKQTDTLKHAEASKAPQECCFSVLGFENSLHLEADREETAQKWIEVLSYLMRGEREEIAERVKVTQPMDQLYVLDQTDPIIIELIRGRNFTAYEYVEGPNGKEAIRRDVYVHLYPQGGRLGSFFVSPAGRRIRPSPETRGMPVNLITDVFTGKMGGVFLEAVAKPAHGRRCFALHSEKTDFQLNLEAQCTEHAKEWINGVHHILTKSGKTRRVQNTSSTDITQTKVYKATYSGTGEDLWAALEETPPSRELLSACLFHVVVDLHVDKLVALLKHGASVHEIDDGQTPLHRCLSFSDLAEFTDMEPVVRLLIAAKASKEVRDDEHKTPTDYCSEATLAALSGALGEQRPIDEVIAQYRPAA